MTKTISIIVVLLSIAGGVYFVVAKKKATEIGQKQRGKTEQNYEEPATSPETATSTATEPVIGQPKAKEKTKKEESSSPAQDNSSQQQQTSNSTPPPAQNTSPQPEPQPQQPTAPQPLNLTIECSDSGCTQERITAAKGAEVNLTFKVKSEGVYYGGLDFRSSVINTGTILPGAQKTVTFTANSSFDFTPYWPASNIQKGYIVRILVQ